MYFLNVKNDNEILIFHWLRPIIFPFFEIIPEIIMFIRIIREIYRDSIRDTLSIIVWPEPESRTSLKFCAAGGKHRVAFDPRIRASVAFSRNGYETEPCGYLLMLSFALSERAIMKKIIAKILSSREHFCIYV